jgi:hypothetical protein
MDGYFGIDDSESDLGLNESEMGVLGEGDIPEVCGTEARAEVPAGCPGAGPGCRAWEPGVARRVRGWGATSFNILCHLV